MATAAQKAWRAEFARRFGGKKKKAKKGSSARKAKGGTMARRRRSVSNLPRRTYRAAKRRVYHRKSFVIPWADVIHGVYTMDGATDKKVGVACTQAFGGIMGTNAGGFDSAIKSIGEGATWAFKNPQSAVTGAGTNFAKVYFLRKGMGWLGIPKTVKITKGVRIQTGAL